MASLHGALQKAPSLGNYVSVFEGRTSCRTASHAEIPCTVSQAIGYAYVSGIRWVSLSKTQIPYPGLIIAIDSPCLVIVGELGPTLQLHSRLPRQYQLPFHLPFCYNLRGGMGTAQ